MANIYTWNINQMTAKIHQDDLENVIFKVSYTYIATYEDDPTITASVTGSIDVEYTVGDPFIPYADLTKEDVVGWLEASPSINIPNMQENLDQMIDDKKNPIDEYLYPMWS